MKVKRKLLRKRISVSVGFSSVQRTQPSNAGDVYSSFSAYMKDLVKFLIARGK